MLQPETGPENPNTAHHFQQVFDYTLAAAAQEQKALLTYIESEPELNAQLQNFLRSNYDLSWAIGIVRQIAHPPTENGPDPFDEVLVRERYFTELQLGESLQTTGLQLNPVGAPKIALQVTNVQTFGNAIHNLQLPADEETREHIQEGINETIADTLHGTALSLGRRYPEAYVTARGRPRPNILSALGVSNEDIAELDAKSDFGTPLVDALIKQAPKLVTDLDALGINTQHLEALRQLHTADSEALRAEWAVAHDLGLFSTERIGSGRLITEAEWDEVIDFLGYLQHTSPNATFTLELRRKIIADIEEELQRPFDADDPDEDSAAMSTTLNEDQMYEDMSEDTEDGPSPLQMERDLLSFLHIAEGGGIDGLDEEEARSYRIEQRQEVVRLLEIVRSDIFAMQQASSPAEQPSAETGTSDSGATASVADIATAILSQEIALYEAEQILTAQRIPLTEAHLQLLSALEGTNNPHARMAISGLAKALTSLENFLVASATAARYFRRYQP